MTQLDRALVLRDFGDILLRAAAAFVLSFAAAPVLHFLLTVLSHPFSRAKLEDEPGRVSAFLTPFLLCFLYLVVFLAGPRPALWLRLLFWAVPLLLALAIFGPARGAAAPATPRPRLAAAIRASLAHSVRGSRALVKDGFLPARLFPPDRWRTRLAPLLFPLLAAYGFLLLARGLPAGGSALKSGLLILFTLAPPVLFFSALHAAAGPSRKILTVLFGLGWLVELFLLFFHFTTGSPLDWSLILTNKDTILKRDAFIVYSSRIQWPFLVAVILMGIVWPLVLRARFKALPARTAKTRSLLPAVAWAALMAVLLLTSIPSLDELALFGRSVRSNLRERITEEQVRGALPTPYPYARPHFPLTYQGPRSDRPDVFLVLLESFNERLVEKTAPNGVEVTPVFNALLRQGVYVENFYNNTMQTSRALFVIFGGVYESYKGKAFRSFTDLNLRPLPEILDDEGYRTVFFNAHDDLNFDNKGPYLRKMGFRTLVAMTGGLIEDVPADKFWNWGIQDDVFFRKSFDWLDAEERRDPEGARAPLLAVFLTLAQHYPHDRIPPALRFVYPKPKVRAEHFMNAQYLTDLFLAEFFRQLEGRPRFRDAIIILTGDHSFPAGEHGNFNEQGFYEEGYRTPFLVIWKDHLQPGRIGGAAYDQVDIAPTILDLLGLDTPNHFIGRSLFAPPAARPLLLTQPYDGQYLSVVDYPFKYVRHLLDGSEKLFDVAADPGEERDLSAAPAWKDRLRLGRRQLDELLKGQVVLEMNRVWDPRIRPRAPEGPSRPAR
jgi:hypothetical protein